MTLSLALLTLLAPAETDPQPYNLGPATAEGAKLTVTRLLEATAAQDDAAFDKIARGMVIMLAPDFGAPISRLKFTESLKDCTPPHVVSAEPFPKMPQAQAVRVAMRCHVENRPAPVDAVADFMADDQHVIALFPGGVSRIWPATK